MQGLSLPPFSLLRRSQLKQGTLTDKCISSQVSLNPVTGMICIWEKIYDTIIKTVWRLASDFSFTGTLSEFVIYLGDGDVVMDL